MFQATINSMICINIYRSYTRVIVLLPATIASTVSEKRAAWKRTLKGTISVFYSPNQQITFLQDSRKIPRARRDQPCHFGARLRLLFAVLTSAINWKYIFLLLVWIRMFLWLFLFLFHILQFGDEISGGAHCGYLGVAHETSHTLLVSFQGAFFAKVVFASGIEPPLEAGERKKGSSNLVTTGFTKLPLQITHLNGNSSSSDLISYFVSSSLSAP